MPLATKADLKERLSIGVSDTSQDALLTDLLGGVSALLDQFLDRVLLYEDADITENFDGGVWDLRLRRWPVTSLVSVKESSTYGWPEVTALTADSDFIMLSERGILTRLADRYATWLPGRQVIQVVYRGGYNDPAVEAVEGVDYVPPHVQEACLLQATDLWNRKDEPGYKVVVGMQAGISGGYAPAIDVLPMVKSLLRREHR